MAPGRFWSTFPFFQLPKSSWKSKHLHLDSSPASSGSFWSEIRQDFAGLTWHFIRSAWPCNTDGADLIFYRISGAFSQTIVRHLQGEMILQYFTGNLTQANTDQTILITSGILHFEWFWGGRSFSLLAVTTWICTQQGIRTEMSLLHNATQIHLC